MANSMGNALHWPKLFTRLTAATVDFVEVPSVYCTRATHWGKSFLWTGKDYVNLTSTQVSCSLFQAFRNTPISIKVAPVNHVS